MKSIQISASMSATSCRDVDWLTTVPLDAYSISHFILVVDGIDITAFAELKDGRLTINHKRLGSRIKVADDGLVFMTLTLFFYGITDYELFFSHIENKSYREKAALLFKEAEECLERECWHLFSVGAASVVEAILADKLRIRDSKITLGPLIEKFCKLRKSNLSPGDIARLEKVKAARNAVHPTNQVVIKRAIALEIRTLIDNLIWLY